MGCVAWTEDRPIAGAVGILQNRALCQTGLYLGPTLGGGNDTWLMAHPEEFAIRPSDSSNLFPTPPPAWGLKPDFLPSSREAINLQRLRQRDPNRRCRSPGAEPGLGKRGRWCCYVRNVRRAGGRGPVWLQIGECGSWTGPSGRKQTRGAGWGPGNPDERTSQLDGPEQIEQGAVRLPLQLAVRVWICVLSGVSLAIPHAWNAFPS